MAYIANPDWGVCSYRTWSCLDITRFNAASHSSGLYGRLAKKIRYIGHHCWGKEVSTHLAQPFVTACRLCQQMMLSGLIMGNNILLIIQERFHVLYVQCDRFIKLLINQYPEILETCFSLELLILMSILSFLIERFSRQSSVFKVSIRLSWLWPCATTHVPSILTVT